MSDFSLSGNWFIYPTFGVAGVGAGAQAYKGSYHSELQLGSLLSGLMGTAFIFSGFSVPASSGTLTLAVPLGVAMISGRQVTVPGSTTVTCAASQTNYIFLKLTKDTDGYVLSASFEVNITGTCPADGVAIAKAVAGVSTITSTVDLRPLAPPVGSQNRMLVYSAAGTYSFLALTDSVTVWKMTGGGNGGAGDGGSNRGGGGGGGGFVIQSFVTVPGQLYDVVVGAIPGGITTFGVADPNEGRTATNGQAYALGGFGGGAGGGLIPWTANSINIPGGNGGSSPGGGIAGISSGLFQPVPLFGKATQGNLANTTNTGATTGFVIIFW